MSNVSIFKQNVPATTRAEGVSELTKALAGGGSSSSRRISTRGMVFRKVVNGEEVGKLKDREMNVIIVNALPKVSRQFYAKTYDPSAEATLPDCWSNLGDVPDPKAENPQAASCVSCPQNVDGSGQGGRGRACRFQRRVALVLEGDMNGDVYQMNFASKSLFGKGEGNVHPFESYIKFLAANNESIDRVVTQISFDSNEDSAVLKFSPVRHLTDDELDVVIGAASSYEAKNAIQLTVAAQDGAKRLAAPKPAAKKAEVVEVEEVEEPVKRTKKTEAPPAAPKQNLADVISAWSDN